MPAVKVKWRNASKENPGYTVWYATPERDENVLYVVRRKRTKARSLDRPTITSTGNIWRVFMRATPTEPLHTIFVAEKLDGESGAKTFVQEWEEMISVGIEAVPAPNL